MDRGNMEGLKKRMRGRKKEKGMERDRYIDIFFEYEYFYEDLCLWYYLNVIIFYKWYFWVEVY